MYSLPCTIYSGLRSCDPLIEDINIVFLVLSWPDLWWSPHCRVCRVCSDHSVCSPPPPVSHIRVSLAVALVVTRRCSTQKYSQIFLSVDLYIFFYCSTDRIYQFISRRPRRIFLFSHSHPHAILIKCPQDRGLQIYMHSIFSTCLSFLSTHG